MNFKIIAMHDMPHMYISYSIIYINLIKVFSRLSLKLDNLSNTKWKLHMSKFVSESIYKFTHVVNFHSVFSKLLTILQRQT
jgi:hypothetical protein